MIAFTDLKIGKRYRLKSGHVYEPTALVSIRPSMFDQYRDGVRGRLHSPDGTSGPYLYYRSEWTARHSRTAELV